MKVLITTLFLLASSPVQVFAGMLVCDYGMYGAHFATLELDLAEDGSLPEGVRIIYGQSTHMESVTPEFSKENELYHLWISKERSENTIEMVVYKEATPEGNSKMINPNIPMGKVMWGNCK